MYGTSPASLTTVLTDTALVTAHSRTITGLTPGVTYFYKVSSADAADNVASAPPDAASFVVPAFVKTDTTPADFTAGTLGPCRLVTRSGDGELTLTPTEGSDFGVVAAERLVNVRLGRQACVDRQRWPTHRRRRVHVTNAFYTAGRSLEFVATFQAVPFQHVGFADDLNNRPLWAIFSTGNDGASLKARTNNGGATRPRMSSPATGSGHHTASGSIGPRRKSCTRSMGPWSPRTTPPSAASMRPAVSDFAVGGPAVTVDWLDMTPYTSPCSTSRTLRRRERRPLDDARSGRDHPGRDRDSHRDAHLGERHQRGHRSSVVGEHDREPGQQLSAYRATLTTCVAGNTPVLEAVTVKAAPDTVAPLTSMLVPSAGAALRGAPWSWTRPRRTTSA